MHTFRYNLSLPIDDTVRQTDSQPDQCVVVVQWVVMGCWSSTAAAATAEH